MKRIIFSFAPSVTTEFVKMRTDTKSRIHTTFVLLSLSCLRCSLFLLYKSYDAINQIGGCLPVLCDNKYLFSRSRALDLRVLVLHKLAPWRNPTVLQVGGSTTCFVKQKVPTHQQTLFFILYKWSNCGTSFTLTYTGINHTNIESCFIAFGASLDRDPSCSSLRRVNFGIES